MRQKQLNGIAKRLIREMLTHSSILVVNMQGDMALPKMWQRPLGGIAKRLIRGIQKLQLNFAC